MLYWTSISMEVKARHYGVTGMITLATLHVWFLQQVRACSFLE